jgi:hypothetical protein
MLVGIEPLHAGQAGLGLARSSLESVSQLATLYRQHQHLHRHDQHAPWRPKVTRVTPGTRIRISLTIHHHHVPVKIKHNIRYLLMNEMRLLYMDSNRTKLKWIV